MSKGKMSEKGLESLIEKYLIEENGYEKGNPANYDAQNALDREMLFRFLYTSQKDSYEAIGLDKYENKIKFLKRLDTELTRRGVIDVLKKGINYYPSNLIMFYLSPNEKNPKSKENYEKNIFSVTRQLHYSQRNIDNSIDMVIFVNGLPIITIELKNRVTGQDYRNAVKQYKLDRDPRETLLKFKRCLVHFAMDECEVMFCTKLEGKNSFFMPFNKGYNDGAGNPPNPYGQMSDYIWKDILKKDELTNIIENYAQVIKEKSNNKKKEIQIFPRFHQLRAVKRILADVKENGLGKKYLIQHSAGSGKSNSITWLAYQLASMEKDGEGIFDSIIIITDRVNLDKQLTENLKSFMQVSSALGHADDTAKLRQLLIEEKKIIVSTVQKFPFLLDVIGNDLKSKNYGIIIDEAHSSQSGKASASMNMALSGKVDMTDDKDTEDRILEIIEGRKMMDNASYFAFTATPKSKTLEMFGTLNPTTGKKEPFDNYSMKQAIEEGFILDVLSHYTCIKSYYNIVKTIEANPEFDAKKSRKKIRKYVEGQEIALREKAEIIVNHFHECTARKIRGKARAMVVTSGIERAIDYYYLISKILKDRNSPYKAIIAFSGKKEYHGKELTEASINGFSDNKTPEVFKQDPYRFLIVADKYQTGFDEPLLHTMYVDKTLNDVKAVQTLSRLNRCMFGKTDTCVLDFANEPDSIQESFSRFYTVTKLDGETDPNKLYDLLQLMDDYQVYDSEKVQRVVDMFLADDDRSLIDAILDGCVFIYNDLQKDEQVEFKSAAKAFVRNYNFLASIIPIGQPLWEKMCIFLTLLVPKLPAPREEDLSKGIIDAIDLDSYRAEKKEEISISLSGDKGDLKPSSFGAGTLTPPELNTLDQIVKDFNNIFGHLPPEQKTEVEAQIEVIPDILSKNDKLINAMKNSSKENAKLESDSALKQAVISRMKESMVLFKMFNDDELFRKWLSDSMFNIVYKNFNSNNYDNTYMDLAAESNTQQSYRN